MFGELAVCYLFLGGAGAAAIAGASLVDLLRVKEPFGAGAHASLDEASPAERVVAFGLLTGCAALAFGALCLVFDLGRLDRVLALLLAPSFTYVTVGAFSIVALGACSVVLVGVRFLYVPRFGRRVVAGIEVIAVALAFAVMVYTGLLLQGLGGVALWRSPLVPVLFVLSSTSCGIAVLLVAALLSEADTQVLRLTRGLLRIDLGVIVLEAAAAAAFAWLALVDGHPGVSASMQRLVEGDLAAVWWVGFVACGLLAPFAVELVVERRGPNVRAALVAAAVLVLVGGLCLRAGIVEAGAHRELVLESVSSQQQGLQQKLELESNQVGAQAPRS